MHEVDARELSVLRDACRDAEIGVIVAAEMLHRSSPDDRAFLWQMLGERIAEYHAARAAFDAALEAENG